MDTDTNKRIGIEPGTRLSLITRHTNGTWRIWTAIKDPNVPFALMKGTYVLLKPDGSVRHCTVAEDGFHDSYEVLEKRDE